MYFAKNVFFLFKMYVFLFGRRCLYDTKLFYNKLTAQIPNIIVENG